MSQQGSYTTRPAVSAPQSAVFVHPAPHTDFQYLTDKSHRPQYRRSLRLWLFDKWKEHMFRNKCCHWYSSTWKSVARGSLPWRREWRWGGWGLVRERLSGWTSSFWGVRLKLEWVVCDMTVWLICRGELVRWLWLAAWNQVAWTALYKASRALNYLMIDFHGIIYLCRLKLNHLCRVIIWSYYYHSTTTTKQPVCLASLLFEAEQIFRIITVPR